VTVAQPFKSVCLPSLTDPLGNRFQCFPELAGRLARLARHLRLVTIVMNSEYDIFEKLPDDGILWRGSVYGQEGAMAKLRELAANSNNEHFVLHVATNSVVARVNTEDDSEENR
jgi:hypothetical protein